MDLARLGAYYDAVAVEVWDSTLQAWQPVSNIGQIKPADRFTSLYHRASRRRMWSCAPEQEFGAGQSVIRLVSTAEVYMIGTPQRDTLKARHYNTTYPLNRALGPATIKRKAVQGPSNDPGPLVETTLEVTWGDVELRTVFPDREAESFSYGSHYLVLPSNCLVEKRDFVELGDRVYRVDETYLDSGFRLCRVTDRPDDRITLTYIYVGDPVYDTSVGGVVRPEASFSISARVTGFDVTDVDNQAVLKGDIRVIVEQTHIGVEPKLQDKVLFGGYTYRVVAVAADPLNQEWQLLCRR